MIMPFLAEQDLWFMTCMLETGKTSVWYGWYYQCK